MALLESIIKRPKVKWGLLAALIVLAVAYLYIAFSIAQGLTGAERNPQEGHPRDYGLEWEDVSFYGRNQDVQLLGWYLPGEGPSADDSSHVIFVHGLSSVRSGGDGEALELASRLVAESYNVLLFDLRGHGSSEGDKVSGGYFERWDVLGAYDYLVEYRGATAGRVGLLGYSMGAVTSILASVEEPGIEAIVADSPFAAATDLIVQEASRKTPFPEWLIPAFIPVTSLMAQAIYGIDIGALNAEKAVVQLDYPLLIIHGEEDERVPIVHGQRVAAAAPEGTTFWSTDAPGHVESFAEYPEEYFRRVSEYFQGQLR